MRHFSCLSFIQPMHIHWMLILPSAFCTRLAFEHLSLASLACVFCCMGITGPHRKEQSRHTIKHGAPVLPALFKIVKSAFEVIQRDLELI